MKSPARFFLCTLVLLGLLLTGCATGSFAPLIPAENEPYTHKGTAEIKGLVTASGAPADKSTVYLCPDTKHFADWAARAGPWLWEPGKLSPLGADEQIYVRKKKTDVAGRFSFVGLPPGSYIVVNANGGTNKVIRLQEGRIIEVKLENSMFEGNSDHPSQLPIPLFDPF